MQGLGRCVIANIAGDRSVHQMVIKTLQIGAVGQKSTLDDDAQEFRFGLVGHHSQVHAMRAGRL